MTRKNLVSVSFLTVPLQQFKSYSFIHSFIGRHTPVLLMLSWVLQCLYCSQKRLRSRSENTVIDWYFFLSETVRERPTTALEVVTYRSLIAKPRCGIIVHRQTPANGPLLRCDEDMGGRNNLSLWEPVRMHHYHHHRHIRLLNKRQNAVAQRDMRVMKIVYISQ